MNDITPSDLSLLIADDGRLLREKVGVTNELHHAKIVRAITIILFGLGARPRSVDGLTCLKTTMAGTHLLWISKQQQQTQGEQTAVVGGKSAGKELTPSTEMKNKKNKKKKRNSPVRNEFGREITPREAMMLAIAKKGKKK